MKRDNKGLFPIFIFGLIITVWFALLIAPAANGGLPEILRNFNLINNPFHITLCEDSQKTVLVLEIAYVLGFAVYVSSRHKYHRRGEEHGSASWGVPNEINKHICSRKKVQNNVLLTDKVKIGIDNTRKHKRNLNVIVIGGSGAGKTRAFAKPNIMQCNSSFVCLDPKGEITRAVGGLLKERGYIVKVLDLRNMEKSHCYNPFVYLRNDNDVQRLVTNLFKATSAKNAQTQDPFWDTAASMLLLALVFFLHYEAPSDEQNFPMVMELLRAGDVREDEDQYESPLDELFQRLNMKNPNHIALKYYKSYHSGAAKTLKSIQVSLAARLEKFNLDSLAAITTTDELNLPFLGEKKTVIFAVIPDNDTSYNFLISILYTQLFQQLFDLADYKYHGQLPIPVHFLMDEFANGVTRF